MLAWLGVSPQRPQSRSALSSIALEYKYDELQLATDNFHMSKQLGCGSYGAVFRGQLGDGTEVAIKRIDLAKLDDSGPAEDAGFDDEVRVLSKFRHPNLVTLMGWARHGKLRLLVYELLPGGDLQQRLTNCKEGGVPFSWQERLSVLLDSSCGLSHMHNATPKAFHRDIKTPNILLDKHGTAKMADFGLSCIMPQGTAKSHVTVKNISGTPGYADPYYISSGKVTEANEIYSFGMVVLEVLMNDAPAQLDERGGFSYPIFNKIKPNATGCEQRVIANIDETAHFPPSIVRELATMALGCITRSLPERPLFSQLVRSLRSLQERGVTPWLASGPDRLEAAKYPYHVNVPSVMATQLPRNFQPKNALNVQPNIAFGAQRQVKAPQVGSTPPQVECVVLECVFADGVDLYTLASEAKRITIPTGSTIGREKQVAIFENLVPNRENLCVISRNHCSLKRENGAWYLRNMSMNPVKVNESVRTQEDDAVVLTNGSHLSFLPRTHAQDLSAAPFLQFVVRFAEGIHVENAATKLGTSMQNDIEALSNRSNVLPYRSAAPHCSLTPRTQAACDSPPCFVCIYSVGLDVQLLPREDVCLRITPANFGRQHQPVYFESMVTDNALLCCISRTHFEVTYFGGDWNVQNISLNPLYVDGIVILKGTVRQIVHGSTVAFMPPSERGSQEPFLTLQAKLCNQQLPPCDPKMVAGVGRKDSAAPVTGVDRNDSGIPVAWVDRKDSAGIPTFSLEVLHAENLNIATLDEEDRVVSSEVDATTFCVGRSNYAHWFDKLLRMAPSFLVFISRHHVQLKYDPVERKVWITNLSGNPLFVDNDFLAQRVTRCAEDGAHISMATTCSEGTIHFVKLKLWVLKLPNFKISDASSDLLRGLPHIQQTILPQADHQEQPAAFLQPPQLLQSQVQPHRLQQQATLSAQSNPNPSPKASPKPNPKPGPKPNPPSKFQEPVQLPPVTQMHLHVAPVPVEPVATLQAQPCAPGHVTLELCGRALKAGVTAEQKQISWGRSLPLLTVGRRAQLELHRECLSEKYQSFVSRNHFSLQHPEVAGNPILLTAVATNPIYLRQASGSLVLLPTSTPVDVCDGEHIILYTGEEPIAEMLFWRVTITPWLERPKTDNLAATQIAVRQPALAAPCPEAPIEDTILKPGLSGLDSASPVFAREAHQEPLSLQRVLSPPTFAALEASGLSSPSILTAAASATFGALDPISPSILTAPASAAFDAPEPISQSILTSPVSAAFGAPEPISQNISTAPESAALGSPGLSSPSILADAASASCTYMEPSPMVHDPVEEDGPIRLNLLVERPVSPDFDIPVMTTIDFETSFWDSGPQDVPCDACGMHFISRTGATTCPNCR